MEENILNLNNLLHSSTNAWLLTDENKLNILAIVVQNGSLRKFKYLVNTRYFLPFNNQKAEENIPFYLCKWLTDYNIDYHKLPSKTKMLEILDKKFTYENFQKYENLKQDYVNAINYIYSVEIKDIEDKQATIDYIVKFAKEQFMLTLGTKTKKLLGQNKDIDTIFESYLQCVQEIKNFGKFEENTIIVGSEESREFEEHLFDNISLYERIPTNMGILDAYLQGGIGKQELFDVMASTGGGKSTFLINLGVAAFKNDKNVLHISLENTKEQVLQDFNAILLGRSAQWLCDNKEEYLKSLAMRKQLFKSKYEIQYSSSMSVQDIRSYIQEQQSNGIEYDLLVVDYAGKVAPANPKSDIWTQMSQIYSDLHDIAVDFNIAIATASQSNREGVKEQERGKRVGLEHSDSSYKAKQHCDIQFIIDSSYEDKMNNILRGHIQKNRNGILASFVGTYENKKMKFTDVAKEESKSSTPKKKTPRKYTEYDDDDGDWEA